MNFYIVIDTIGQLHGHSSLSLKAKQETPFPILKERTRGEKTVLACSFLRIFMTFWRQSTLCNSYQRGYK